MVANHAVCKIGLEMTQGLGVGFWSISYLFLWFSYCYIFWLFPKSRKAAAGVTVTQASPSIQTSQLTASGA